MLWILDVIVPTTPHASGVGHHLPLSRFLHRWQAFLGSRSGESLKDLVDAVEEELKYLEDVSGG